MTNEEKKDGIVRKFAKVYAESIPQFEHNRLYSIDDFTAGMTFWAEISRDSDGFATEKCLNEMFSNVPFIVFNSRDCSIEAVCLNSCQSEWCGEIERHSYYTHWKPIVTPKIK